MSEQRVNERADKVQASRVGAWLDHHGYSIVASLGRLLRKPWATLLTVGVMAVALALPLGLWLVLGNMARLGGEVRESRDIAIFLKPEIDVAQAQAIGSAIVSSETLPDTPANVELLGRTEYFDADLTRFVGIAARYGLALTIPEVTHHNATERSTAPVAERVEALLSQLPGALRERLLAANQQDLALYAMAERLIGATR